MDDDFNLDSGAPLEKHVVEMLLFDTPLYVPANNLESLERLKRVVANEAKDAMINAVYDREYVSSIGVLPLYNQAKKCVEKIDSASGFVGGYLRMRDLSANITMEYINRYDVAIGGFNSNPFIKEKFIPFTQFYNTALSMYGSIVYVDAFPQFSIPKSESSATTSYNRQISGVEQVLLYADLECLGLFNHDVAESLNRCDKSMLERLSMEFLSTAVLIEEILFERGIKSTPFNEFNHIRGIYHIPHSSMGIPEPISERIKNLDDTRRN